MNSLSLLWLIPLCTYGLSYLYLALYHHQFMLFNTVVHEGGSYTFLQTLFYASHFLGHVPMLTVLALWFTGCVLCLGSSEENVRWSSKALSLFWILVMFLLGTTIFSVVVFGGADTWAFIVQQKQSVVNVGQGGAWNLHLPSTVLQLFLMPVYIYVARMIFRRPLGLNGSGRVYLLSGIFLLIIGTMMFNNNVWGAVVSIAQDPRYLAHSVRELVTFPLIFYPLPLYFMLKYAKESKAEGVMPEGHLWIPMLFLAVIVVVAFSYQALVPLREGIGSLAQKPHFAKGGELNIAYLLASHYFEHFLDTIYFTLVCLVLYASGRRRS